MDFTTLPDAQRITLQNVTVPACVNGAIGDLVTQDITVANGMIVEGEGVAVDMKGAMVLPAFVDMHTHLDKGHISPRSPNPDGTFMGALTTVLADREASWTAEDVRARMTFALKCAYAHGTRAIRTHIDSIPPQDDISFGVFKDVRAEWKDRIDLQASCLVGCDRADMDGRFIQTADTVADANGVLGMVTYPDANLKTVLQKFFKLATDRNLAADFHVDETLDATSMTLRLIAQTVLETGFDAPVTVGHLCSLTTQDDADWMHTLDLVAKAGINVVSLPMCNLYLQDRHKDRTPRYRGVTLVHEMHARGIPVSFASDNTRDPFYAYGDLDMLEVMREATRLAHLDHTHHDWPLAFSQTPAASCGFTPQSLQSGQPADLVICPARNWTELFARPQSNRIVMRQGKVIDRTLPDYAELDHLMGMS